MMECNKEEANRAKEVAETKMLNKDYPGAKKFALKAQQLYPDLENISQLITVCDVHLSAETKAYGNEKDWYGILKIESSADEASIKKQYRKFALLLHPDKNKFAGASDAFKLIGEAQRVLLDPGKRSLHDSKVKTWRPNRAPATQHAGNSNPNIRMQSWAQSNFMNRPQSPFTSFNLQKPQTQAKLTFWTMCPFCGIKYQYYRDVVNKMLWCQRCKKSFTGNEIKDQSTTNRAPRAQPGHGVFNPSNSEKMGSQRNASNGTQKRESVTKTGTSEIGRNSKEGSKSSVKVNGKRKMQVDESSESCDSDSSSESEDDDIIELNVDVDVKENFVCSGESLRRSTRSRKTNVTYKENLSDDDDLGSSSKKKAKTNADPVLNKEVPETEKSEDSFIPMEKNGLDKMRAKETIDLSASENGEKTTSFEAYGTVSPDSSPEGTTIPEIYDYPDPDFNEFDKVRSNECFAVGQIWAAYDTLDAMPRFYARIKKIMSSSEFKLRITWLEPDPDDEDELKWVDVGLPVSCGKLRNGNTDTTDNRLMFSHPIDWEKGRKRDTYKIYPRKGEIWALFKEWDINWHSDPEIKKKFEFEFVEVLSVFAEGSDGISVAYLSKVKGFSCVFCRIVKEGVESFQIPHNHLFRFSHRVPSFRLSGNERKDVPENSFELDPASLPTCVEEIDNPKCSKVTVENVDNFVRNLSESKEEKEMESDSDGNSEPELSDPPNPEEYEIPEKIFFNFDGEKSQEKFQVGQIWALYSNEDGLPKYYGFIKRIERRQKFKLHLTWLSGSPPKNTTKYSDKRMPISCGIFKHRKGESATYTDYRRFSHQLRVESTDRKDEYAFYPRKGEVWALYKNWKSSLSLEDLGRCEYDIVEVLEEADFDIKVVLLELVSGYTSVFKARTNNKGKPVTTAIVRFQLLKFSHQIPAFRLTDEKGGSFRGCWEVDPAALPIKMFSSS